MKDKYLICFHQDYLDFMEGDTITVDEDTMFEWMQRSHDNKVKISIYRLMFKY